MFDDRHISTPRPLMPDVPQNAREFKGVDVFVEWNGSATDLATELNKAAVPTLFRLNAILNGRDQVWPVGRGKARSNPIWQCRFLPMFRPGDFSHAVPELIAELSKRLHWTQVDRLETYTGAPMFVECALDTSKEAI